MFSRFGRKKSSTQVEVSEVRNYSGVSDTTIGVIENVRQNRPGPIKSFTNGTKRSIPLEHGSKLKRYWMRGILAIICPVAITIYWYLVWFVYLIPQHPGSPVLFGHRGAIYVFYSWFLVGIFGLGIGKYGLVGIEASMMMEKRWAAKNAMQVMMHADHSWSGPSGWWKAFKDMFSRGKNRPEPPTPLWYLLAFLSVLPFVSLPLTGLCMELKDGFHPTGKHPVVQGLQYDNINQITGTSVGARSWSSGFPPDLPGLGVIYTKDSVDRSKIDYLKAFPNMLPNHTQGIQEVFLTPQAETPMTGRSFGLMISYNCSTVSKLSDFTILSKRTPNQPIGNQSYYTQDDPDDTHWGYIQVRNSTDVDDRYANNFWAVLEEGSAIWNIPYEQNDNATTANGLSVSDDCYYWAHNNNTVTYPGMDQKTVYEAIMWQYLEPLRAEDYIKGLHIDYNLTLGGNITELYGQYTLGFYDDTTNTTTYNPMSAVGAKCFVSSAIGMADVDGPRSIYSNFVASDTPIADSVTCSPRMDVEAPSNIMAEAMDTDTSGDWVANMFRSGNLAVPFTIPLPKELRDEGNSQDLVVPDDITMVLSFFQDTNLRDTLLRTYPAYVSELLYNGGLGYTNKTGEHSLYFLHQNTTGFAAKKLFETGTINLWIPGSMLIVWAVGTITLAVMYGFRRRWSSTLDGYSMFRFGADLAEKVRDRPEFGVNMEYEECYVLKEIPGLIGDANVNYDPGHITLVEGEEVNVAAKKKFYM